MMVHCVVWLAPPPPPPPPPRPTPSSNLGVSTGHFYRRICANVLFKYFLYAGVGVGVGVGVGAGVLISKKVPKERKINDALWLDWLWFLGLG